MEEVYVIKLKGLPTSADPDAARKPSLYANDLSVDVTLGFACFHVVLGLIAATFGLIFLLGFDQEEWRASTEGIGCGIIFVFSGCIGLWAAKERKHNLAKANDSIKIFLLASILSILTSASFILLTAAGVTASAATDSSRAHLIFHLTLTLLFEMCNSVLSGLTSAKIIMADEVQFLHPKLADAEQSHEKGHRLDQHLCTWLVSGSGLSAFSGTQLYSFSGPATSASPMSSPDTGPSLACPVR